MGSIYELSPLFTELLVFLRSVGVANYGKEFYLDSNNALFDWILYIAVNNFFSYARTGLPGMNQY